MDTGALARAIRGSVEALGVPWGARRRVASPEELADRLAHAMRHFPDYATPQRLAGIIGESAQESDWFCTATEYGSGQRYAPYIGRGFIQLTWDWNYAKFSNWAYRNGLIDREDLFATDYWVLSNLDWAWYPALWFFAANDLGWRCDNGNWDEVSGVINAGSPYAQIPSAGDRRAAINGALPHLWGADLITGDDDMQLSDRVTRPDGLTGTVNDVLGYADVRMEKFERQLADIHHVVGKMAAVMLDQGIQVVGAGGVPVEGQATDLATEAAWNRQNVAAGLAAAGIGQDDIDKIVEAMARTKVRVTVDTGTNTQEVQA